MRVILKRRWFVGGNRYRSIGKSPVEIPDKYRSNLPKDAIVIEEPVKVPKEDASDIVPEEDGPENEPYVNPALELDKDRAFAEAFSDVNKKAKSDVDNLRDQLKNSNKGK